jgi:mannose-6-phosphate isomerase-like protein (cupin superfamily)
MDKVINILECFEKFEDTYSPMIIAELNGQYVLAVKAEGDKIPWHKHENEDELFYVLEGVLDIHEQGSHVTVKPGEFYIVRKGIKHRIVPHGKVRLLLFQPAETKHTGDVKTELTKDRFDSLMELKNAGNEKTGN